MEILKWNVFFKRYDLDQSLLDKWLMIVKTKYSEAHRHYHTLSHVNRLISLLEDNLSLKVDKTFNEMDKYAIIYLSIIFHDLIYDPKSKTNKADSIIMFDEFISDFKDCFSSEIVDQVRKNIESTILHNHINNLCNLFLDFDLEILSSDRETYQEYANHVRMEYHFVQDFNQKRIQVLQTFLNRRHVYQCPEFRYANSREGIQRERSNLISEIEYLSCL